MKDFLFVQVFFIINLNIFSSFSQYYHKIYNNKEKKKAKTFGFYSRTQYIIIIYNTKGIQSFISQTKFIYLFFPTWKSIETEIGPKKATYLHQMHFFGSKLFDFLAFHSIFFKKSKKQYQKKMH